jgi:hypothetical protein
LSQHSLFAAQVSPVGLHDVAGTSHVPLTQLSEQQSVFFVHFWWKDKHVWQLTPGKHVPPEQQPFAQDVALHTHAPLTQA